MEKRQVLIDKSKYHIKCPYEMTPKYITIHNTANDAAAANEIAYMQSNNNHTSFHLAVDDKESVQGIPFNRNAWHSGDGTNGKGNRQSIGIEICYSKSGGDRFNKAVVNAVEITAILCKTYGIPYANIMYHKDWSGKNCPHRLIAEGVTVEKFRQMVQAKYNELYSIPTETTTGTMYQVVCGSFASKSNAQAMQEKLKNKGFSSFLQVKK